MKFYILFLVYFYAFCSHAQTDSTVQKKPVDVYFLIAYYNQDGNHSPVTGGTGTEKLTDQALTTIVNVPLDSISELNISHHINRYSPPSKDIINKKMSSASAKDFRTQIYVNYTETKKVTRQKYGFLMGGSIESDYLSAGFGGHWAKESKNKNRELNLKTQILFDKWLIIIPNELRLEENETIATNKRNSFSLSINYAQVLTKRLQATILTDISYQKGLLSTPFHRVYFQNYSSPKVEKFPTSRFRLPIALRLNYTITDFLVMRNYYRFYMDSFEIFGHTYECEFPIKLPHYWNISPFFRYHQQTSAFFFAPYQTHQITDNFYTSDYDLANLSSKKIGIGLSYEPLYGLFRHRLKNRINVLKKMEVRYAWYQRSDGLHAFIISMGTQFSIK